MWKILARNGEQEGEIITNRTDKKSNSITLMCYVKRRVYLLHGRLHLYERDVDTHTHTHARYNRTYTRTAYRFPDAASLACR